MKNLQGYNNLLNEYQDTFREDLVIKNAETIQDFARKQIAIIKKEESKINEMIDHYNELVFALDDVKNKEFKYLALQKIEQLDIEIDFFIHNLNCDFSDLTKIANAS